MTIPTIHFKKVFLSITIPLFGFFLAGLTGVLFQCWPTQWPDAELNVTTAQLEQLKQLRLQHKFLSTTQPFYPGTGDETVRHAAAALVNNTLDYLTKHLVANPRCSFVFHALKQQLEQASSFDSEEQDRLLAYDEEILNILNITRSHQLLNVWRYGFPIFKINNSTP
jgi:hypothetical protein